MAGVYSSLKHGLADVFLEWNTNVLFARKCWRKDIFYLTTHSTHFIYSYIASDKWLRTILIVRKETRCRHIGYSFWLTARVLLYAPSHRQDGTYHSICYTSHGALAGTRNSSIGPPWRIDPTKHRTISKRSYHGATSRSVVCQSTLVVYTEWGNCMAQWHKC